MKKVQEVTRLSGASRRQLQFYDSEGLMAVVRTERNYRAYDESDIEQLWTIMVYKAAGFTLTEIKELMKTDREGALKLLEEKQHQLMGRERQLIEQRYFLEEIKQRGLPARPDDETLLSKGTSFKEVVDQYKRAAGGEISRQMPEIKEE